MDDPRELLHSCMAVHFETLKEGSLSLLVSVVGLSVIGLSIRIFGYSIDKPRSSS